MGLFDTFKASDFEHVQRIQRSLTEAIKPYQNKSTEAALVAIASMRLAKIILRLYPQATQQELIPLFVAFIRDENKPAEQQDSPLWMPPGIM